MPSGITLRFVSAGSSVELDSTLFRCPLDSQEYRAVRGKIAHGSGRAGTFTWTAGVIGLSCSLVKAKLASLRPDVDCWITATGLSSAESHFAVSLDSALSKNPNWLVDMFGTDSHGISLSRRLFVRINGERKRPGPVIVALNSHFVSPKNIFVELNGKPLTDIASLENLLGLLASERTAVSLVVNGALPCDKTLPADYPAKLSLASHTTASPRPPVLNHPHADVASKQMPQSLTQGTVQMQINHIAHRVRSYLLNPSLGDIGAEPWSCSDAILGLIRHPDHRDSVALHAERLIEVVRPDTNSDALDPPIALATSLMALVELHALDEISLGLREKAHSYAVDVLRMLSTIQGPAGWWSFTSSPSALTQLPENARVWETGYVALALVHAERRSMLPTESGVTLASALTWLAQNYFPGLGWANSPKPPLRISPELTTMLHFVLTYASQSHQISLPWRRDHAFRHARSAKEIHFNDDVFDPAGYRLSGVSATACSGHAHALHLAFMLALRRQFPEAGGAVHDGCPEPLDPLWVEALSKLEVSEPEVYPYSQLLQAMFLFSSRREEPVEQVQQQRPRLGA